MVQPPWKTVQQLVKNELPYDVMIPLWGVYTKELKSGIYTSIHDSIFYNSQKKKKRKETTQMAING